MPNPVAAIATSVILSAGLFLVWLFFNENQLQLEEPLRERRRRNNCESCGNENGTGHKKGCHLTPQKPTNYLECEHEGSVVKCVICQDDITRGSKAARLPCFCLYHKICIDKWFLRDSRCPVHLNQSYQWPA